MADRLPLLLDVDTGIDDSLAILYACASPEIELVGLTCVGGNVPARQVADNSRSLLELVGPLIRASGTVFHGGCRTVSPHARRQP